MYSETGRWHSDSLYSETGKLYSETESCIRNWKVVFGNWGWYSKTSIRKLKPVYLETRQLYSETGSCIQIRHKQQRSYNVLLRGGGELDPS